MGANSSTLIDDLHASVQVADEVATKRKLGALKAVQEYGQDPAIAVQIIEQGGMQPLLRCYNASHPHVRIEAAKALAVLAQQPSNQMEMGADEVLPQYHPALLTASLEFREHAMALLAALATPEVNRIKIAHEGLVAPVLEAMTAPRETLQLHALDALAKLCAVRQIAVLATQRGALPRLLRAARSPVAAVKLAVVRVLCGIASCAENMSAFISSGAVIFLMGCTYCGADLQLEVARCLEGLLQQVYEGSSELSEREAYMLAVMSAVEVNPERISDDSAMDMNINEAIELPIVELIPELIHRIKKLINCDRASVFVRSEDGAELTTISADGTGEITIPCDIESIAGECAVRDAPIVLKSAYERKNFNQSIDRKTGYRTRTMLVVPIRLGGGELSSAADDEAEAEKATAATSTVVQPCIGVIQCINKLGSAIGSTAENISEDGTPCFSSDDQRQLETFAGRITPVIEKVTLKKRAPKSQFQLSSDWVQNIATLASLDVHDVIKVTLDRIRDLVQADRGSLFIHDRKHKQLWSKIADDVAEIRVASNAGIVGAVCQSAKALNIEDAYKDPRFNRRIDTATGYRTRTILCVPIKNQRGEVVAVVQCINKLNQAAFTHEDYTNLDEFCWQTASILEYKAAAVEGMERNSVATGDCVGLLLHLVQAPEPEIQLHAASCIGYLSRSEANRERVVALGGVPVLLSLAMPWPWRPTELLGGISRAMGSLTMSPAVREEIAQQGGWKSLLALAQTRHEAVWFNTLRALANLAVHEPLEAHGPGMAKQLLEAGALDIAISFLSQRPSDVDLNIQAARLAGNLSVCCRDGSDAEATKPFSGPKFIRLLGEAATQAASAGGTTTTSSPALHDYAVVYAKLSRIPAIALWLFDIVGVSVLESFAAATGAASEDVKVCLAMVLANCLRVRPNQRIVLNMLRSHDPTEASFHRKSTTEQRILLLRERDALRTGKEVRGLMTRLLRGQHASHLIFLHYARCLQMLAAEPSNHNYMMVHQDVSQQADQLSYIEQLVFLATMMLGHGDTQATALRGLRLMAEAETLDGIHSMLAGPMNMLPALMNLATVEHEDLRIEVCRLVRTLAKRPEIATSIVQSTLKAPVPQARAGASGESPPPPTPFLALLGAMLLTPSPRLQCEACMALEALAEGHKVEMAQARVVSALIALSHSSSDSIVDAASKVLQLLA